MCNNQEQTSRAERIYDYILYTDASVEQTTNQQTVGRAAIGYILYKRDNDWHSIIKKSA